MTTGGTGAVPPPEPGDAVAWVARHLAGLWDGPLSASARFRGGWTAATTALADFDVAGYARARSEVWPERRRGASALSPFIRHGLLSLPTVWSAVAGPATDVARYRDELLWQEYARHVYARLGPGLARALRAEPSTTSHPGGDPWPSDMACIGLALEELQSDGWLVNQVRMWLASQWSVRRGADWRAGEDRMYRQLLDGSRAANRLGWQWTIGAGTGRAYGFSRWQVAKRAPGLCDRCEHRQACPIEGWPPDRSLGSVDPDVRLRSDPDPATTGGPTTVERRGTAPEAVWVTAESLGDDDPALAAHPDLPAVFVFDAPLLTRLRLAGHRLVFLAECLADLAERRQVAVHVGDPVEVLAGTALATTFAPVPGWRRRAASVAPVELHPWPWLRRPGAGPISSYSAWSKGVGGGAAGGRPRTAQGRRPGGRR